MTASLLKARLLSLEAIYNYKIDTITKIMRSTKETTTKQKKTVIICDRVLNDYRNTYHICTFLMSLEMIVNDKASKRRDEWQST